MICFHFFIFFLNSIEIRHHIKPFRPGTSFHSIHDVRQFSIFDQINVILILCFPVKYWDFSVKSKSILPLVVTSEITIFIFTVSKNGLFMNSVLKVLPKGVKCSVLVEITGRTLTFRDGTAHVIYCADVTFFSARDVSITQHFL